MAPDRDHGLTALVFLGIGALAIYRFAVWVKEAPRTSDPWGDEIDQALHRESVVPICHHCFTPQLHNGWFCPHCGAIVGPYCNYMPYLYIFSEGEVLRAGVTERIACKPLIVLGYLFISVGMFAMAAPIYWFFLFRNLTGNPLAPPTTIPPLLDPPDLQTAPAPDISAQDPAVPTVKKCPWCGRVYPQDTETCPIDGNLLVRHPRSSP